MIRVSNLGLWEDPYSDVIVPSKNITMQGVNNYVLAKSGKHHEIMVPGLEYQFDNYVYEHPFLENGEKSNILSKILNKSHYADGGEKKISKLKEKGMGKSLNKKNLENDTQGVTMEDYISNQRNDFVSRLRENNMNAIADESFDDMTDALFGLSEEQQVAQNGTEQRPYGSKVYLINRQTNPENYEPTEYTITNYNLPLLRRQGRGNYIAKDKDGNTIKIREDLYNDWLTQNANPYIPVYKSPTRYNLAGDDYWRSLNTDTPDIMYIGDENFDYKPKFPVNTELLIQNNGKDSYNKITRQNVLPAFPITEIEKIEDDNDRARYIKNYLKNRATEFGYLNEDEAIHGQYQEPKHSSFKNEYYSDKDLEDLIEKGNLFLHEQIEPVVVEPESTQEKKENITKENTTESSSDTAPVTPKENPKVKNVTTQTPVSKKERQGKKLRAYKYQDGGELGIKTLPRTEYDIPAINALNNNMRTAGIRRKQFNGPDFNNFSLGRFNMNKYISSDNTLDIDAINDSNKFKKRGLRLGTDDAGQIQMFDKDGNIIDSKMKFKGRIPTGTAYAMTNMALNSFPFIAGLVDNIRSPREMYYSERSQPNLYGNNYGDYALNSGIIDEFTIG